jgi:hypothetical protein
MLFRPGRSLLLALAVALLMGGAVAACPFCSSQGTSLSGDVEQASMVLFGTLGKADMDKETTELKVEKVIKDHPARGGKKVVLLPRYIPPDETGKYKHLVFFDVFRNKLDPYRGVSVKKDSDLAEYLAGAIKVQKAAPGKRLKYFFNYLDNPDFEIQNDAYKEFANAKYEDYATMAKDLPADRIAGWLKDKETANFRIGLYASMLGHCGKAEHAKLLHDLLEDRDRRLGSGVDGMLAGYIMLDRKAGWKYTRAILGDGSREFMFRHAALRTVRFMWQYRPDLVSKKDLADGAALLLKQKDVADFAIEDFRKWKQWDRTDEVLALANKDGFNTPIIRRAILRFALRSPEKSAKTYVESQRKKDPQAVIDAEGLLKLEEDSM